MVESTDKPSYQPSYQPTNFIMNLDFSFLFSNLEFSDVSLALHGNTFPYCSQSQLTVFFLFWLLTFSVHFITASDRKSYWSAKYWPYCPTLTSTNKCRFTNYHCYYSLGVVVLTAIFLTLILFRSLLPLRQSSLQTRVWFSQPFLCFQH